MFRNARACRNLPVAVGNVLRAIRPGGVALITVPIEIGLIGVVKFSVKMAIGAFNPSMRKRRYGLRAMKPQPWLFWRCLGALLRGNRLGAFRAQRRGYGTHLGFDYRDFNDELRRQGAAFVAWNCWTTRFYRIDVAL